MKKYRTYILASIVFIAAYGLSPYYRTDVDGATKVLKTSGYTPLKVGGFGWFSGSKTDFYSTKFKALSISGDTVTGVVTRGFFTSSAIRID